METSLKINMFNNSQGFAVTGEDLNSYDNNVDTSNVVNGIKIYYILDKTGLSINPLSYTQLDDLILVNCTDATIENIQLNNSYGGIHIVGAKNSTISNNNLLDNTNDIWIQFSSDCTVYNNIV